MGQFDKPEGYPLHQYAADAYMFTSVRGNTYSIQLIRHWQEDAISVYLGIDIEIYEIYFEIIEIKDRGYDKKILPTVLKTVLDFLKRDYRIGFFNIYREDGRGRENLRVYRMWMKLFQRGMKNQTIMINRVVRILDQEDSHIGCLIPHNTCNLFADKSCDETVDFVLKEVFPSAKLEAF